MVETTAMKIRIVEYDTSLAGKVADMWNKSQDGWGGERTVMTEEHVRTQEENSTNKHLYIALDGDRAVGYCGLSEYRDDDGALYIPLLNVRDDYHGKKIGKALVLKALQRAIELKWPRLDLYTWAGNTKAVPLYKKCGFFWEERDDTVHLMNFIPTVLNTEVFAEFFQKANWYGDSSRKIEVKPDGTKENGFDFFEYSWEQGNQFLKVQFEKTGRGMRLIETDAYCIWASIEKPALVVGRSYPITYRMINKTDKPLSIRMNGINNNNIKFSYDDEFVVANEKEVVAHFFVDEIFEEQNNFRTHPTVTTELYINEKKVEFKLGVMPKFPAKIEAKLPANQCFLKSQANFYIELENNFDEDTTFSFQLPEAPFISLDITSIQMTMSTKQRKTIAIPFILNSFGYYNEDIIVTCNLANGETITFQKKLSIAFPGIGTTISGECENYWHLYCGRYHVALRKANNALICGKGANNEAEITLSYPKLGKPFSEEFSKLKPKVSIFKDDGFSMLKATYESRDFSGLHLHSIVKVYLDGLVEHYFEIENNASEFEYMNMAIYDQVIYEFNNSIFSYKGQIVKLNGKYPARFSLWNSRDLTENWIFSKDQTSYGLSWHNDMKLFFANWCLYFEHKVGTINPSKAVTTRSKFINLGAFSSWEEQRAFALQTAYENTEITFEHLELNSNEGNPFTDHNEVNVNLENVKQSYLDGNVELKTASSNNIINKAVNYEGQVTKIGFEKVPLEGQNKIEIIEAKGELNGLFLDLKTVVIKKDTREITKIVKEVAEKPQYILNNGVLELTCDPEFYPGVYSIKYGGYEWLDSSYPTLAPKAWWNPWSGGIRTAFEKFRPDSLLKEERSAQFVTLEDQYRNRWEGIRVSVDVKKHDEYKGLVYHQYFLLLQGTPVVCYFVDIQQNTSLYFHFRQMFHSLSLNLNGGKFMTVTKEGEQQWFSTSREEVVLKGMKQIAFQPKNIETFLQIVPQLDFDDFELYTNKTITDVSVMKKVHLATETTLRLKPTFLLFHSSVIDDKALKSIKTLIF